VPPKPLPTEDLKHVLTHARAAFEQLRGANLFLTGVTGFFGHALLEPLLHANRELNLNLRATVLTRSADAFAARAPHIAHDPAITLLEGEIVTLAAPTTHFTHILHAATDSTGAQAQQTPDQLAASILEGTRRVLAVAASQPQSPRLLYISTGAVYGRSADADFTPETYPFATDTTHAYDQAKREAETLCANAAVIARPFAFIGPHLPMDAHFAIGNFLGAALAGKPITIHGDGTPRRSWMHTADLAIWLWTLLTHGQLGRAYNVGSDEAFTIAEAAHLTADTLAPGLQIHIERPPASPRNSYVPDITRARTELNLQIRIPLREALQRTAAWHRS
jgi:dTDP-glucose 4,6-dehydratase